MGLLRYAKRTYVKFFFVTAILVALIDVHMITQEYECDVQAEQELMKTPDGKNIPKYNANIKMKTFGELSKTCGYIHICPDVRHHGETVFRQSQLAMNRILKVTDAMCKRHNTSYWISYGTLLGAVRHKGIVPWDHDVDVCMIDKDYDKLALIARKELPDDIMFADINSDPSYPKHLFAEAKLRDVNSCYGVNIRHHLGNQDGVQVDIFTFKKEIRNNEDYLIMVRGPENYPYSNVFPVRPIHYDGFELDGPIEIDSHLKLLYGNSYMLLPKPFQQCPMYGKSYISMPWIHVIM